MILSSLAPLPSDSLLGLIKLFEADPEPRKIDLGVGVYRDAEGRTTVMEVVKEAERRLVETQATKTYLAPDGNQAFLRALATVVFGEDHGLSDRLVGCQSVGGSGALQLAATLANTARPGGNVWVGVPTWPNHEPLIGATGLTLRTYDYLDRDTGTVRFDRMVDALKGAEAGDLVLLHACCHNPTGADLSPDEWRELAALLSARGLVPFIDIAYQGFAAGLDEDAAGLRAVVRSVPEAFVAYSCSKNFGLYRERTGALFVLRDGATPAETVASTLKSIARKVYSMPPDHGAAVVETVLSDPALNARWREELSTARNRLRDLRATLAGYGRREAIDLAPLARQNGMFSLLKLSPEQTARLQKEYSVYMAPSGRISLTGLTQDNIPHFVAALEAVARA